MYKVTKEDSASHLADKLERAWNREVKRSRQQKRKASLLRAFINVFGGEFMFLGLIAFIESCWMLLLPVLISHIVSHFASTQPSPSLDIKSVYGFAGGFSICIICSLVTGHQYHFRISRLGMKIRVCATAFVYRKAVRLSGVALGKTTVGQLVNILSNDVNRFDQGVIFLHYLWIAPLQLCIVSALLWPAFGPYSLLGPVIFCLLSPFQAYMGRLFSKLRSKTALLTDERVRIMNEIISGMRVVKIYTWEKPFAELVRIARRNEVKKVMSASYLRAFNLAFFFSATNLIAFVTFVTYSLTGNALLPSKVYLAIPLYNVIRLTLVLFVPFAVMNGMESRISIKRIQAFLELEELSPKTDRKSPSNGDLHMNSIMLHNKDGEESQENMELSETQSKSDVGINVTNLTGSWEMGEDAMLTLEDLSFSVGPGELLAVIGPVGCGKSSLLMALLGEMPNQTGTVSVEGKIGYTAQQPWVFSGTLRNNILFGEPYNKSRYERVIKNCALKKDLEQLPAGDMTLVGERGVTLSGGQRARVSLARAVYNNADVFLLDDPLSAVDTTVGRQLFEDCISGLLANKPRILVTHQLQYLHDADKILILKKGKGVIGTYEELEESGIDFALLLKERKKEEKDDENDADFPVPRKRTVSDACSVMSIASAISEESHRLLEYESNMEKEDEDLGQLSGEEKAAGSIGVKVYMRFFLAGCSMLFFMFFMVINLTAQGVINVADWWLAEWTYAEENALRSGDGNSTFTYTSSDLITVNIYQPDELQRYKETDLPTTSPDEVDSVWYAWIYSCLVLGIVIFSFGRTFLLYFIMVNASKNLHNQMFNSIIRAPMQFFDSNPVGRILNRFAKDIGFMDELLPTTMGDFNQISLMVLGVVIFICVLNPMVLLFTLPLCVIFIFVRMFFLQTSRDVKRLEGITRSPVFSHLSATLQGLSTVRAFQAEQKFCQIFDNHQDLHTQAWFLFLSTTRWFGVVIDSLSAVFVIGVAFSCIIAADIFKLDSGLVGLSLSYALSLMGAFQWGVRQSAEVENQMTSTERVLEYVDIKPEADLETDFKPGPDWPKYGLITLEGASLRYTEDGPDVLKKLYGCIRAKEKVGIVGRTGAGKSSLMTVLMRIAEPKGTIMIDGVDITDIGLHHLRQKLSFIPQDPVLFSGTLRKNLDPFTEQTDMDIWRALEEVQLKPDIECLDDGLHTKMAEGGSNFSVGQRQLVCLARAILRRNRILIVDEATANVDLRTDRLIQSTIRDRFRHCTVLTVAHRLNTVMDSDRIMVLDHGKIMEFDEPYILLQKEDGFLTKMVLEAGKTEAGKLIDIAKKKYDESNPEDLYGLHIKDSERSHLSSFIPSHGYRALNIETSL
ncbi:ATP-binding cassette sub-family C member 4-like [Amphiura filiformis]|uniref:ATP-binding cassette sub-family C member 4-like n=1 Tax=Amphiura filiformis TaxID=82378 RepID=UPI003B2125A7